MNVYSRERYIAICKICDVRHMNILCLSVYKCDGPSQTYCVKLKSVPYISTTILGVSMRRPLYFFFFFHFCQISRHDVAPQRKEQQKVISRVCRCCGILITFRQLENVSWPIAISWVRNKILTWGLKCLKWKIILFHLNPLTTYQWNMPSILLNNENTIVCTESNLEEVFLKTCIH